MKEHDIKAPETKPTIQKIYEDAVETSPYCVVSPLQSLRFPREFGRIILLTFRFTCQKMKLESTFIPCSRQISDKIESSEEPSLT